MSPRVFALFAPILLGSGVATAAGPALPAGPFHTTGGAHKLKMQPLARTESGMKVRFTDPTRIAFNGRQRSITVELRHTGDSAGWARYEGQTGDWGVDMTMERKALAGERGAKISLGLTQDHATYGYHFQLKN